MQSAPSSRGVAIEYEIAPRPLRIGAATVTVKLADGAQQAIAGARVALEADMSHPDMNPVFGEARELAPGRYQATVTFSMSRDWVLLLHITLPDGQKFERQVSVNVKAS